MKKLLITTDSFLPRIDGVAKFLIEVIPRLTKYFKITVIAPNYGKIKIKNVKIIQIPLAGITLAGYKPSKFNRSILHEEINKADIVFNHTIGPIGLISILYSSRIEKPLISFIHSIEWELFSEAQNIPFLKSSIKLTTKKLAKILYNRCNKIMVPSEDIKEILNNAGIKTKKEIITMGLEKLHTGNTKSKFKLNKYIIIGYLGRLSKEKDLPTLLRAFKLLQGNVKLLLVGDGPVREQLKSKNVIITGFTNKVNDYLNAMDIFVMPSLTETSSIATLEAMRSGLPVISTPTGYMKYMLKNGKNGFIFNPGDFLTLKELIEKLIKSPSLRKKLGKNARASVSKLNWDKTSKEIYKKLI